MTYNTNEQGRQVAAGTVPCNPLAGLAPEARCLHAGHRSFKDAERSALLAAAAVVLRTSTNKRFGNKPFHAMAARPPVLT